MKNLTLVFGLVFGFAIAAPVSSDEVGPAKPKEESTTTQSTTMECSFVETVLGTCETEEAVSE